MDLMMRSVPVRMAAPEIYESLTRGTLDGLIFSYQSSVSYDFGKILKSGTEGLNFGTAIFTYSRSSCHQLAPVHQPLRW